MKILIFTASTGGGHKRAAAALKEYFEKHNAEVRIEDGVAMGGKAYNGMICGGYSMLAKRFPRLYGNMYRNSDKKSALNSLCNNVNKSRGKHLLPLINEFKPDAIISCHAFVTTMLGALKTRGLVDVPVISIVTDFKAHYTYIAPDIDHYIVSSDTMVREFEEKYGISPEHVHPYGIPVLDKFETCPDVNELKDSLGLVKNMQTILFMAGSFGVTEVLGFYKEIAYRVKGCQFIVITGNNKKLYDKFETVKEPGTKLMMFVDNVEDYMHCSDLIITKPGGLTVSESLQCRLPMAIYSAYPGQEADNADFLEQSGTAVKLGKNPAAAIHRLISDKLTLRRMSEKCVQIRPCNSPEKIYELLLSLGLE